MTTVPLTEREQRIWAEHEFPYGQFAARPTGWYDLDPVGGIVGSLKKTLPGQVILINDPATWPNATWDWPGRWSP